jgi:hypothetical protein
MKGEKKILPGLFAGGRCRIKAVVWIIVRWFGAGGERKGSRGCERLKVRQGFLRVYAPPCVQPLVGGSKIIIDLIFAISFLYFNVFYSSNKTGLFES